MDSRQVTRREKLIKMRLERRALNIRGKHKSKTYYQLQRQSAKIDAAFAGGLLIPFGG